MLRVLYLILILVFSNGVVDAVTLREINVKSTRVIKSDINNDNHDDYLKITSDLRKPIIVYMWNGKNYTESLINSSAIIDDSDEMDENSIFVLQGKNEKIVVYTCSLYRIGQGRSYGAGNIVGVYKYSDGNLLPEKEYYTKYMYDEESEKMIIRNNIKGGELSNMIFLSEILNEDKTHLLLQTVNSVFIVDSSGELIKLNNYVPEYMNIRDFNIKDSNVEAVVSSINPKSKDTGFQIWSSKENKFSNKIIIDTPFFKKARISDGSFEVEMKKDNKLYRHKFIIHDDNKIEKIKTEKIGFWHKLINFKPNP